MKSITKVSKKQLKKWQDMDMLPPMIIDNVSSGRRMNIAQMAVDTVLGKCPEMKRAQFKNAQEYKLYHDSLIFDAMQVLSGSIPVADTWDD